MKKFRMMLPVMAVIFAVVGAIGGDLLPISQGYYKISGACSTSTATLVENDCIVSTDPLYPICHVNVGGLKQAFDDTSCQIELRHP